LDAVLPRIRGALRQVYIYPYYHDRYGTEVTKGEQIVSECRELLNSITFSRE